MKVRGTIAPLRAVATAEAHQVPDSRVADLVQAGKVRVGMHSFMYTKDPEPAS